MAALTADRNVPSKGEGRIDSYPVKSNTTIYKGSLVSLDANGVALPSADTTLTHFIGVADEQVVNPTGGTKNIRVVSGRSFLMPTGTISATSPGLAVYVTDSATASLTDTNAIYVGQIETEVTTTSAWVFVPHGPQASGARA